jgi:hypothetical protein
MTNPRHLLERDIERQLRSGPKVHAPPIIVSAKTDATTLLPATQLAPRLDSIDLHGETCGPWDSARRVGSAATIAQDATVRLFTQHIRSHSPPSELAVSSHVLVPKGIGLSLHDGSVTLEGQITWNYRRDAERAIQHLSNAIGLRALDPQCPGSSVKENVEGAQKWLSMDGSKE